MKLWYFSQWLVPILNQPAQQRQVFLTRLCLNKVLILYPKVKLMINLHQSSLYAISICILATPVITVSTTPNRSQYFLTMNSPILNSKLASLETKVCGKMEIITSYFKDALQPLKKTVF